MNTEIQKILLSGKPPHVIFLYGEEEFLMEEAYRQLSEGLGLQGDYSFSTDIIDGESTDLKTICDLANSFPMMADRKYLVVSKFDKLFSGRQSKKNTELNNFMKVLAHPPETTFMIFRSSAAGERITTTKAPFDVIFGKHKPIEFKKIWPDKFPGWIGERLKARGRSISPEACELLLAQSPASLRDLDNELEKLLLFTGEKKKIEYADVNELVGAGREFNEFELQKAVGRKDINKSLFILNNILERSGAETRIVTALSRYFIALWKLPELAASGLDRGALAARIGVNQYFLNDYTGSLSKFHPAQVERSLALLCETEEKLKSSAGDSLFLLQKLVIDIIENKGV